MRVAHVVLKSVVVRYHGKVRRSLTPPSTLSVFQHAHLSATVADCATSAGTTTIHAVPYHVANDMTYAHNREILIAAGPIEG